MPERPKTSATKPGAIRKLAGILTRVTGQPFTHKSRPLEEFLDKMLAAIRQGTRRGVRTLISTASRRCRRAAGDPDSEFPVAVLPFLFRRNLLDDVPMLDHHVILKSIKVIEHRWLVVKQAFIDG
jgi:hypothetical protein